MCKIAPVSGISTTLTPSIPRYEFSRGALPRRSSPCLQRAMTIDDYSKTVERNLLGDDYVRPKGSDDPGESGHVQGRTATRDTCLLCWRIPELACRSLRGPR